MIDSIKKSSIKPEINGKGVVRQFRQNFGHQIDDTNNISEEELIESFSNIINGEVETKAQNMLYFKMLAEEEIDYVTGSDSHRIPEINIRNYYFELFKKAMNNEPLTLSEVGKHLNSNKPN